MRLLHHSSPASVYKAKRRRCLAQTGHDSHEFTDYFRTDARRAERLLETHSCDRVHWNIIAGSRCQAGVLSRPSPEVAVTESLGRVSIEGRES